MKIVISSGHGKHIRGASGYLDEVNEARKVVNEVAKVLRTNKTEVKIFHDNTSHDQSTNLHTIVNYHNAQTRDLDVSVHFNAYVETPKPMGTECLYVTQSTLAGKVAGAIAGAGHFINRGPKKRTDLYFLNNTEEPAILIETCFVDSSADADLYRAHFKPICLAIAEALVGHDLGAPAPSYPTLALSGRVSWFGGPNDTGVAPDEGLAFLFEVEDAPTLFLPQQPPGTTGLARRLDPQEHYIAVRWDYDTYPKDMLASGKYHALVRAPATGKEFKAQPADWGPHGDTQRVADISPGLMELLGIKTDDEVEVTFPAV